MPSFRNLKDLMKHIQKQVDKSLTHEVAKIVKDEIQMAVDEVVYQSGVPKLYQRRGGNEFGGMGNTYGTGSLADQQEMKAELVKSGELQVTNEADFNHEWAGMHGGYGDVDRTKSLSENIEYGYGDRDEWWNEPRPFMHVAAENIKQNKSHVEALKEGLEKRGINVK